MSNHQSNASSFTVHAGAYQETVVGLTEAEYRRQQALSRRALLPTDIPNSEWDDRYAALLLREDGVIVPHDGDVALGAIQREGKVFWFLSYYAYHGLYPND